MKGVALNLQHSSENREFWDSADAIVLGAGHAVSTLKTSAKLTARSLRQHRVTQRQVSNQASDDQGLLWNHPQWKYPSTLSNVKRGFGMAASQVMGIGVLQWPS